MDSRLYNEIGEAAKVGKTLTEKNLPYVWHVANELSMGSGVDVEELFMVGVTEMCRREAMYDPEKNTGGFTKYCGFSVRCEMMNYINRGGADLVHIPANLKRGFKKGQEECESAKVSYTRIDAEDYDSLGISGNDAFKDEKMEVVMGALDKLDDVARIAVEMKYHLGKYGETEQHPTNPDKLVFKYPNNMEAIANELEVPVPTATKILNSAMSKLRKVCKAQYGE